MNHKIDLNADLGEGKANDKAILRYVSSCNIACGGHTGNRDTIINTIELAQQNNVKIGAHPAYADVDNFGRKSLDISTKDLTNSIERQLDLFQECIKTTKVKWHHIKFHGALYNDLKTDTVKANALVELIKKKYRGIILFVPPNSVVQSIAKSQIPIKVEGFADRAYNEDLSLVSRQQPNAVLKTSEEVIKQVKNIVIDKFVKSSNSTKTPLNVDTICIHGDTPQALEMLEALVDAFQKCKIEIK